MKLALLGLGLVAITQWSFMRSNPEGKVTLEFVGLERRGTNNVQGTIVAFRLRNKSGTAISYGGISETVPVTCAIEPMLKDDHDVFGGNLSNVPVTGSFSVYVLEPGEEKIVCGEVFVAEQSWRMTLHFWEGNPDSWWDKWVPYRFRKKLWGNVPPLEIGMVQSEPVHVLIPPFRNDPEHAGSAEYITYPAKTNLHGRVTGKFTRPMFALPKGFEIGEKIDVKQLREKTDNPGK